MTAPTKSTSRWGSLISQAVAGMESRLDNILAEGSEEALPPKKPATPTPAAAPGKSENGIYLLVLYVETLFD